MTTIALSYHCPINVPAAIVKVALTSVARTSRTTLPVAPDFSGTTTKAEVTGHTACLLTEFSSARNIAFYQEFSTEEE